VEVEIQLLDENTFDLKPSSLAILPSFDGNPRVKAELFQSMLEINTGICRNAHEVHLDLSGTFSEVQDRCRALGIRIASAGTHPFARYHDRVLFPASRYKDLIQRNQWIARRLMIFGLHVHVGMRSGEHAIQMNNALLHYLPMFLSLSASSPYWHGEDTELASSRITFFEALPTGGHPCHFSNWEEYERLYQRLVRSKSITSPKDIWWDVRPSPEYGTLEIRICDGSPTLSETVSLTALIHSLAAYIDRQLEEGRRFRPPPDWILRENKWRAARHGVNASFILNEEGLTASMTSMLDDLLRELAPVVDEFGYQSHLLLLRELVERGPSYCRQRRVAQMSDGNLLTVVGHLAEEFENRAPIWMDKLGPARKVSGS
jgi:carboxylate-amine ligase